MSKDAIIQALLIAAIVGLVKFIRDVTILKAQIEPLLEWYKKVSFDAMKFAANPTSERLQALSQKYIDAVTGKGKISSQEKQELIDGLLVIYRTSTEKRQSASMSLRFIETQEKIKLLPH